MIKIENVRTVGWEAAIRGARNPMNSWEKSDSVFDIFTRHNFDDVGPYRDWIGHNLKGETVDCEWDYIDDEMYHPVEIGPNDLKLLSNLAKAGSDEAKFRRMIVVYLDVTAPMYWWKECDTYKVGTVRNSCSTMHKIHDKEFTLDDFSTEHLFNFKDIAPEFGMDEDRALAAGAVGSDLTYYTPEGSIRMSCNVLNYFRDLYIQTKDKKYWWQMIQLLPSSYNQRATLMFNYEVLANMYHARKNHKLDEWREFCKWIETLPYAKELIVDAEHEDTEEQLRAYEDRIRYLETQLAKELYSKGLSIEDISNWMMIPERAVIKYVEDAGENKEE